MSDDQVIFGDGIIVPFLKHKKIKKEGESKDLFIFLAKHEMAKKLGLFKLKHSWFQGYWAFFNYYDSKEVYPLKQVSGISRLLVATNIFGEQTDLSPDFRMKNFMEEIENLKKISTRLSQQIEEAAEEREKEFVYARKEIQDTVALMKEASKANSRNRPIEELYAEQQNQEEDGNA